MQKTHFVSLFFIVSFILAPIATFAQTVSNGYSYTGWRERSADFDQKVMALGTIAEQNIPIPILFGVSVGSKSLLHNFGQVRASGRTHAGEDIVAPKGTPIVSPTAAVVIKTDYGAGEGNAVYTANPGGETFIYYHLDRFAEGITSGQVLQKGDLIGYVGNTGDAIGGAAHLHFEIRQNQVPSDPYLRLTAEFTPQEKISYLTKIVGQSSDPNALAQFLVTNFRTTFAAAQNSGIALPEIISTALATIPVSIQPISGGAVLPPGDLAVGSSGEEVRVLQRYLIAKSIGPAAQSLALAGATGNFATKTKAALIEFQIAMNVSPADGYYGPGTRAVVSANPLPAAPQVSQPASPQTPPASVSSGVFTRNLYRGMGGEDVRMLQKILNAKGFTVAQIGNGSPGNEIPYFGPGTYAALKKYQTARGISPVGYVGPNTRAALALETI